MPVVILPGQVRGQPRRAPRTAASAADTLSSPRRDRVLPALNPNDVLLAVDLGRMSAYAACVPGHAPQFGHRSVDGKGDAGVTFLNLWHWLNEIFAQFEPTVAVTEEPYVPRFTKTTRLKGGAFFSKVARPSIPFNNDVVLSLYGMRAITRAAAVQHKIHYQEYEITKVCRFFTGKGSWGSRDAKKAATMRMCQMYGFPAATYDESDALAVLMYAEALIAPRASQSRGVGPLFIPPQSPAPHSGS